MDKLDNLLNGSMPPWIRRIIKQTGRGINNHNMIRDKNRILLGISGGKDSLVLALALALRKKWLPIDYELEAVQIDWREYPIPEEGKLKLMEYFKKLGIPFSFKPVHMFPETFKGKFNCYLCSRNRKRVLFTEADEKNINLVALGHHQDDIIETTLINMIYHGTVSTMLPVQDFFDGKLKIIRPMCEVPEKSIQRLSDYLELPIVKVQCPYHKTNLRADIKVLVQQIHTMNKEGKNNLYKAPYNIISDYLPKPCIKTDSCLK